MSAMGRPRNQGMIWLRRYTRLTARVPWLPDAPIAAEDFFSDCLEEGFRIAGRRRFGPGAHHGKLRARSLAGIGLDERGCRSEAPTDGPTRLWMKPTSGRMPESGHQTPSASFPEHREAGRAVDPAGEPANAAGFASRV